METTDKGTLKIRMDNECRKFVVFNPINRTVWMRKCELIELFDVYTQTIDDCIQGIIKANVFDIETVCKCDLTQRGTESNIFLMSLVLNLLLLWRFG